MNQYGTIDALLERWPAQACQPADYMGHGLPRYAFGNSAHVDKIAKYKKTDTKLLKKLLAAGIDPNGPHLIRRPDDSWSTPWCEFLKELVINEESSRNPKAGNSSKVSTSKSSISCETFGTPHIQTAIETLLEYGAELELSMHQPSLRDLGLNPMYGIIDNETPKDKRIDPLATLRAWLPMDKDSKWPRILETYLQPTKREEIRV